MPISAQEWRARTGLNNAGRVCRPVSSSASSGKWEGVTVGRGVCVPGPLLYKACTLVLLMLLLLAGISEHEPGGQINIADPSSVPGLQSEVCVSVLCVVPVLCMAYSLVVRMLLLLSGNVERNPGPTIIEKTEVAELIDFFSPIAAKWESLGLQLLKDRRRLDVIKLNRQHDPYHCQMCLEDVLDLSVNLCEATYEDLANALYIIEERKLASNLCQKYGIEFSAPDVAAPLPSCLAKYSQTLKEQYRRFSVLPDSEWPPSVGDQFINLALINEDIQCATGESVQEMQRDYVRGKVDKIVSYKKKISKEDIFQPVYNKRTKEQIPLCVLLDGAPGAGKTTLCRELCQEWADGKLLQNYELVVLVHLRERNNKQAQSIEDFFFHDPSILRSELAKHINRENVLFIFDGFDELSYEDRTQHSVFLDIIAGRVLHKCSVVVTSRPHASETLQRSKSINRHVQVLGFTDEQISECIKQTVKDESKAKELRTCLKERLDLTSLCSIPLNCAIMLYVYQQENFRLPNTVTELFDIFTVNALTRHAKRMRLARKLQTLNDLPPPLDRQFIALCKMAYEGLREHKLIFSEKDLEMAFGVTDTELHTQFLDLLTSNTSYTSRGEQKTYHFLHLTIQEFLAAKWLEGMCKTAPGTVVELFKTIYKHDHLRLTLLFVAGLTRLEFSDATDALIYTKPNQSLNNREFQQKVMVFHFNVIFEARNDQITQLYAHGWQYISITPEYMTDFDYFVVAYFLSHSKSTTWEIVKISGTDANSFVSLTEKQLKLFCKGFSASPISELKIEYLSLYCTGMESLLVLSDLEHIYNFKNVVIEASESCFESNEESSALRVRNVSEFRVRNRIQGSKIHKHFEALSDNSNLKSFTCEVDSDARHSVYIMISRNKCLTSLTLCLVHHVTDELLQDISQGLVLNTTLQTLSIIVSPHVVEQKQMSMGCILRHLNIKQLHLEQLVIDFLPTPPDYTTRGTSFKTEAKTIADALANTGSLKQFKLIGICFTPPELNELQNGFQKNKTLQKLQTAYYDHEFGTTCKAKAHAMFVNKTCGGCEKGESEDRKLKECSRCKTISYCSKECQRNDWPRHRPDCAAKKCGVCTKSELVLAA